MFTDTHAHLDYAEFAPDFDDVLARAKEAGIARIITIGTGVESSRRAIALAEKYEAIYAVVGLHPTNVDGELDGWLDVLRGLAAHPKVVAIGETGLDYHRLPSEQLGSAPAISALQAEMASDTEAFIIDGAYKAAQGEAFAAQVELAVECGLNVVVHQRDAWKDTLDILAPYAGRLRAVFHCFGNTPEQAMEVIRLGHLVSFTGIVTFKNAVLLKEVVSTIPDGSFMLETDCPYLAPVPHRGQRCEPAYTRVVAAEVAALRKVSMEELSQQTEEAVASFFHH